MKNLLKNFLPKEKPLLKYSVGQDIIFANGLKHNSVTGQTILYFDKTIIYIVPKEIPVKQTHDQSACALTAKVLNYDISENITRLRKEDPRSEKTQFMLDFLYKMKEYLDHVAGDTYNHPKKITSIYR
jgi:hypothetical protein